MNIEWTDLFEMIADVQQYIRTTGQRVEVSDDPMRRCFGYRGQSREWRIKLTHVRNSSLPPLSPEQYLIAEKFRTPAGRFSLLSP